MSKTYKITGINLQVKALGEADRLLTILSPEQGLMTIIAVGARKPKAKLGGRTGLFVVNELLLVKGRTFDRLLQAETLESYPSLANSLGQLAAAQYLIELTLGQALRDHPQYELFSALRDHLKRLEQSSECDLLPCLTQASFHLLALAGIAPQVYYCCRTRERIQPNFNDRYWRVGFSQVAGGILHLDLQGEEEEPTHPQRTVTPLTALELMTLQQVALVVGLLPETEEKRLRETSTSYDVATPDLWTKLERLLRDYAQYHFDRPLRSATLLDSALG